MSSANSFGDDLKRFSLTARTRFNDGFVGIVAETSRSIVEGSEITGAPGQPVGQYGPGYNPGKVGGTLRASWQTVFESPTLATIGTNLVYARPIEDGIGAYGALRLRSTVGGFHSVRLTIAGFRRIVSAVVARLGGGGGA